MKILRLTCCLSAVTAMALVSTSGQDLDYASAVLADSPSAYYRFEEILDRALNDSSVNAVPAIVTQNRAGTSPAPTAGLSKLSLAFSAPSADDFGQVSIPFSALVQPVALDGTHSGQFSAELWVRPAKFPKTWSVPIEVARYPLGWNIYVSGADAGNGSTSYFYLVMRGSPIFNAAIDFPIQFQQWYHLVVTLDGGRANLYVNGVRHEFDATGFTPMLEGQGDVHVGSGPGVGWQSFDGAIDEVAFYPSVLSETQVKNHYSAGTNALAALTSKPVVTSAPASATNYSGLPVTFAVTASGTPPLHYRWTKNNGVIGSDSASVTFTPHFPEDESAQIAVEVSNIFGSVTSGPATLTLTTNLTIVSAPASITRRVGSHAAFHVSATGAEPLTFQWSRSADGTSFDAIAGATNRTLWLTNLALAQDNSTVAVPVSNPFVTTNVTASLSVQSRTEPVPTFSGYRALVAADHPVAYYPLDETDGTTAGDVVGSFDGTFTPGAGNIAYAVSGAIAGSQNKAVDLQGGAAIQIPFAPELNPDAEWSAEAWINPSSLGADGGDYRVVLSSQYNSFPNPYNGWYIYQQPNHTLAFVPQPANAFIVAAPEDPAHNNLIVAGRWYHLVVTDDLTNFNLYLDGKLRGAYPVANVGFVPNGSGINSDGSAGLGGLNNGNTVIGQRTDAQFNTFQGTIDEVAFYNYALTPLQVLAHTQKAPSISIIKSGAGMNLVWPVGILQSAPEVDGNYSDVSSAISPQTISAEQRRMFWRVRLP